MIYSHHDDWDTETEFDVDMEIVNIPFSGPVSLKHYRIDSTHSNAYAEWVAQGKSKYPSGEQYEKIKAKAGLELYEPEKRVQVTEGKLNTGFMMPAHAVSLIEIKRV